MGSRIFRVEPEFRLETAYRTRSTDGFELDEIFEGFIAEFSRVCIGR